MSDDIVKRLRAPESGWPGDAECIDAETAAEGAAEIERLTAENDMLRSLIIDAPTKAERDELFDRRFGKPFPHEQNQDAKP